MKKTGSEILTMWLQKQYMDGKYISDRAEYEALCKLNKVYPMREEVDWYWHFNELKNRSLTKIK